jgi:hypothetical protein
VDARSEAIAGETPLRRLLANVVWTTHMGVLTVFVCGWALPWRWALWAVVVLAVVVQVSWWTCDDRCPLTVLEERLRGDRAPPPVLAEDEARPANFVANLGAALLGRPLPHRVVNLVIYAVTWSAFTIAAIRLAIGAEE